MIVYRLCGKSEIQEILNTKCFNNIGNKCINNLNLNNHEYESNKKYLHFFQNYDSLFYLYLKPQSYICTYDIPDKILEKYIGDGYYLDRLFMERHETVIEYAIPSEEIAFDYLQRVEKITKFIDFDDYFYGEYKDSLETIYDILKKEKTYIKTII